MVSRSKLTTQAHSGVPRVRSELYQTFNLRPSPFHRHLFLHRSRALDYRASSSLAVDF
jgi:hypothetical protein